MDYRKLNCEIRIPNGKEAEELKIFNFFGKDADLSDFARATGATNCDIESNKVGNYLLLGGYEYSISYFFNKMTKAKYYKNATSRRYGVRPCLPFSSIKSLCSNIKRVIGGILEADLGLFPDDIVDGNLELELNNLFEHSNLKESSSKFTTDSVSVNDTLSKFIPKKNKTYEYDGNLYARVQINISDETIDFNGKSYKNGDYAWFKLNPIGLWIDKKADIAVFKKIPIGGIQYDNLEGKNVHSLSIGNFNHTNMYTYLNKYLKEEIMQIYEPVKEQGLATIENDKLRKFNFLAAFLERIYKIFPFLKKKTAIPENLVKEIEVPNIIDAEGTLVPEEDKALEVKKEEVEVIDVERINELCDYIREKAPLLIPTKRKEILEKLRTLLSNNQKEMDDLDSDMYIKYNLTVCDYDTSKKILWQELNGLKLEVDTALNDVNNLVNYGLDYVTYLKNLIEEYRKIDKQEWRDNREEYLISLLKIIDKIDADFNKIAPYLRDEILELIFLTINTIINIPWKQSPDFKWHRWMEDSFKGKDIGDKLINWFLLYYLENEDKLDENLRKRYYNLKFDDRKENKLYYIVELAHIIDPTLFLDKEPKVK